MIGQRMKVARRHGRFTIYGLVDRRDGVVRYVGCTSNFATRLGHYRAAARSGKAHSRPLRDWFKRVGHGNVGAVVLATAFHGVLAEELEQLMIDSLRPDLINGSSRTFYTWRRR